MDDRRFDSLTKAVASGASRRSVLKGILGLGGAALAVGTVLEGDTDAARRPTPTPTPVKCPGSQTWNGSACVCPGSAPSKCGPACCTEGAIPPGNSGYSECCDNACCFGTCYGEELCCPTNTPSGGGAPVASVCDNGECCLLPNVCINGTCGAPSGCQNNDDCDDCETCNPDTGECSPSCTGDQSQCCVNERGEYCIAEDRICCSSSETCVALCPVCLDPGYCFEACGCQGGQTYCVTDCCDNASEVCDENSHTCVCIPGRIECDGACIEATCCGDDNAPCADLGYDLECVTCITGGVCATQMHDFQLCIIDSTQGQGFCSGGQCLPCHPNVPAPVSECTHDSQCCDGNCLGGRCDTPLSHSPQSIRV